MELSLAITGDRSFFGGAPTVVGKGELFKFTVLDVVLTSRYDMLLNKFISLWQGNLLFFIGNVSRSKS